MPYENGKNRKYNNAPQQAMKTTSPQEGSWRFIAHPLYVLKVMSKSVCIFCGEFKTQPYHRCKSCRAKPSSNLELAKSIYLSDGYQINDDWVSNSNDFLNEASNHIKNGSPVDFDQSTIDSLLEQKKLLDTVTWKHELKFVLFGACFLIIPITVLILWLLDII